MTYTQDLFSSRRNFADGNTRIGELDRIWYDPLTNTLRRSDGTTPGGIIIGFGGYIGSNVQIQSDWAQTDIASVDYIKNKPNTFGYTGSASTVPGYTGSTGTGYTGSEGPQGLQGYTGSASDVIGYTGSATLTMYYGAFHKNSTTTLSNSINANTTSPLAVASTTGFTGSGCLAIETELIGYTGISGNTFTGITRHVGASGQSDHSAGVGVGAAQITSAGTAITVFLDTTDLSSGVTLNPITSEVTIVNAGTYNCQFSIQVSNYGNSFDDFVAWFVVDGQHVPYSASYTTLSAVHAGKPGATIMTVNIFYTFTAGQKLTIEWTTIGGDIAITSYPPVNASIPASPAVILTVNRIA